VRFLELYCGQCAKVCLFGQPQCQDGHGADCDEWACTGCGDALLIASFPPVRVERRRAIVRQAA
jgi:heterodisulfide reductase subunit A-like polyferredoxin